MFYDILNQFSSHFSVAVFNSVLFSVILVFLGHMFTISKNRPRKFYQTILSVKLFGIYFVVIALSMLKILL